MSKSILTIAFIFCFGVSIAQIDSAKTLQIAFHEANRLVKTFETGDHETFIELTHPIILDMMGGKQAVKSIFENELEPGLKYVRTDLEKPKVLIISNDVYQCSIPQKLILEVDSIQHYTTSSLIGVSYDFGKQWKFIAGSGRPIELLQLQFPELSEDLEVIPQQPPMRMPVSGNEYSFEEVNRDLQNVRFRGDIERLRAKFQNYKVRKETLIKGQLNSKLRQEGFKLEKGQISSVVKNKDGSCGTIKVLEKGKTELMRVSHIFLRDKSLQGEKLADQIIKEFKNGAPFPELAAVYSKDLTAMRGGDLGWFRSDMMVKDFTDAVRAHSLCEIYKVNTKDFGWYVILNTHQNGVYRYAEVVEVVKPNCNH